MIFEGVSNFRKKKRIQTFLEQKNLACRNSLLFTPTKQVKSSITKIGYRKTFMPKLNLPIAHLYLFFSEVKLALLKRLPYSAGHNLHVTTYHFNLLMGRPK